jgi:signal recognition particle subunit SRP9
MYLNTWEEFERQAERLYLGDPERCRYSVSYSNKKGAFKVKMTDNAVCLQYKSETTQDLKKMEKFINNLMRHMASNEH